MLDSSNLIFQDYHDTRIINCPGFTVGQSGPLKLAISKDTDKRYIVKYTYPHNAANEYVAMWLAEKLSVPAPHAFLLTPSDELNSEYAVAIEYIDELKGFDKANVPEHLHNDLIGQFILNWLIDTSDTMQMGCSNNHIYSYDFSEGFGVTDDSLLNACLISEDACVASITNHLQAYKRHLSCIDFDVPGLAKEFHLDPKRQKRGMITVAKRILTVSKREITAMCDEIGVYAAAAEPAART